MTRKSFAQLLSETGSIMLPSAHDALSARMIGRAGFPGMFISGFGIAGCQLGLPDLGLASFGEISAAARNILSVTDLPVLMDGDDGYGDVKNVTRTVRTYEQMGAAGLILEDQASPKKCGHTPDRRRLVPIDEAEAKLGAALAARKSDDFFVVARTDARSVEGLDGALERGRRYVAQGVNALFVEAPLSIEELKIIGESFEVPLLVNAAEGGRTPLMSPSEYKELGFSMIIYPGSLLPRMIGVFEVALAALAKGEFPKDARPLPSFATVTELMGMQDWMRVEAQFTETRRV